MAKSKVYELAIKINGKLDSSLKKACAAAAQNLETVGNAAKTMRQSGGRRVRRYRGSNCHHGSRRR